MKAPVGTISMLNRSFRPFWWNLALLWVTSAILPHVSAADSAAVFEKYCVDCHDSQGKKSGGLTLDSLRPDDPTETPQVWEEVIRKLRHRHMPPAGKPRPDESTYNEVIDHLESALDEAAAETPRPGREVTCPYRTRFESLMPPRRAEALKSRRISRRLRRAGPGSPAPLPRPSGARPGLGTSP